MKIYDPLGFFRKLRKNKANRKSFIRKFRVKKIGEHYEKN